MEEKTPAGQTKAVPPVKSYPDIDKKKPASISDEVCIAAHMLVFCNRAVKGLNMIVEPVPYFIIDLLNKGL